MDVQNAIAIVGGLMGIAGTIAALFSFTYKRGSHEAVSEGKLTSLNTQVEELKKLLKDASRERQEQFRDLETKLDRRIVTVDERFEKVDTRIDKVINEFEQKINAQQAGLRLMQEQRSEDRQYLLEHYMTNENIEKIEKRAGESQERLSEQLVRVENKLDQLLGLGGGSGSKLIQHRST